MSLIGRIFVKLGLDNSEFKKGMSESEKQTGKFSSFIKGLGPQIAAAFSVTAIIGFAKKSVQAYNESALAVAKLESVLKTTGNAAGLTSNQMIRYAADLQNVTKFEDDATIGAMSLLATFKGIKGDVFKGVIASAMDMSTIIGGDLQSNVFQLAKALERPAEGIQLLNRSTRAFSAAQIEDIKKLVTEGKTQEAQLLILTTLQGKFGGAAKAAALTAEGAWTQLGNAIGDTLEIIGSASSKTGGFASNMATAISMINRVFADSQLNILEKIRGISDPTIWLQAMKNSAMLARAENRRKKIVDDIVASVKNEEDAQARLGKLNRDNLNSTEKLLKTELQNYLKRKDVIVEETEAIANGAIPQLERQIELSKQRANLYSDPKVIIAINDETAALEKQLAVLKMTSSELMRYNQGLNKIGAAPSTPSGAKGVASTSLNKPTNPISIQSVNANAQLLESQRQFNADFDKEVNKSTEIADRFGSAVAQSMSDSMQMMADAIMSGEKIDPSAMVKALLMPFADMAIQMGEVMVATGVAALAAKAIGAAGGGVGAIAAGAALMAIGSAASAAIGSIGSKSFGGQEGGSKTGYTGGYGGFNTASAVSGQSMSLNLQGVLKGEDIYLSVQKTEKKRGR